jgi:hypothetical protein
MAIAPVNFNPYQPQVVETCGICLEEMEWEQVAHECVCNNPLAPRVFHAYHRTCLRTSFEAVGRICPGCRAPVANRIQLLTTEQEPIVSRFMRKAGWKLLIAPILPTITGNAAAFLSLKMGADYRQATNYYYDVWIATGVLIVADLGRHLIKKDYI